MNLRVNSAERILNSLYLGLEEWYSALNAAPKIPGKRCLPVHSRQGAVSRVPEPKRQAPAQGVPVPTAAPVVDR